MRSMHYEARFMAASKILSVKEVLMPDDNFWKRKFDTLNKRFAAIESQNQQMMKILESIDARMESKIIPAVKQQR
jgi:hypothetical protein